MIDLAAEFIGLTRTPVERELTWLIEQGVRPDVVHGGPAVGDLCGPVAVSRITIDADTFTFMEDGRQAYVHPFWDEFGDEVIDLVAWFPSDPSRWFQRTGSAVWLGEACVRASWKLETPLLLRSTPLSWLAHRGHGAVPLDRAAARYDLLDLELVVEDVEHGGEIDDWLTLPAVRPRILVTRAV